METPVNAVLKFSRNATERRRSATFFNAVPALIVDTAVLFFGATFKAKMNNQKCRREVRFSSSKYTKMRLHRTGELTALPQTHSWLSGAAAR